MQISLFQLFYTDKKGNQINFWSSILDLSMQSATDYYKLLFDSLLW